MNVLVTGAAGYIGSHAVQRLLRDGHTVVAIDNLSRGHKEAMRRLANDRLTFHEADIGDKSAVAGLLRTRGIGTVMHFGALAYVGESVTDPLTYYRNNVSSGIRLLEACDESEVDRFVFSSSCATYGEPAADQIPIRETCPQFPVSPYGRTKLVFEHILTEYAEARRRAGRPLAIAMLRYFNVAGADRSGVLGEDHDPETHLIPVAIQAALGRRDGMTIFGTDYPTPDGTCIRDYVHVEDLIDAHVRVMDVLESGELRAYNVGIGRGYSVREIIESVRRVTGEALPAAEGDRRPGDPAALYADPAKIRAELGWKAEVTEIDEIVASAYRWMREHPAGYASV